MLLVAGVKILPLQPLLPVSVQVAVRRLGVHDWLLECPKGFQQNAVFTLASDDESCLLPVEDVPVWVVERLFPQLKRSLLVLASTKSPGN